MTTRIINWYDLYRPIYPSMARTSTHERLGKVMIEGVEHTYKKGKLMKEYTPWAKHV